MGGGKGYRVFKRRAQNDACAIFHIGCDGVLNAAKFLAVNGDVPQVFNVVDRLSSKSTGVTQYSLSPHHLDHAGEQEGIVAKDRIKNGKMIFPGHNHQFHLQSRFAAQV